MKKLLIILLVSFATPVLSQDSTYVIIDPQGNGTTAWQVSKFKNGLLVDKYNTTEDPNKPDWRGLKMNLFSSPLYLRAITEANPNAYATLLKLITDGEAGDANEQNFLAILNMLGMTFSESEKAELNGYFEANKFTIRL